MKTYNQVAEEKGLSEPTKSRFIAYMRLRWGNPKDEDIKCRVGYAQEWAERFRASIEYQVSDKEGQRVLTEIDS